jgi:hypothetical protein
MKHRQQGRKAKHFRNMNLTDLYNPQLLPLLSHKPSSTQ